MKKITIDGITYVPESELSKNTKMAKGKNKMKYVIARTYSAGVFAGYLEKRVGREVILRDARRLWYWEGAASLSQLAMSGTSLPDKCKFPESVDRVELLEAIEILDVSEAAQNSINSVKVWKQ